MKKISVVVPCYNEQEALPIFYDETTKELKKIPDVTWEFVLVDDGSGDTAVVIRTMQPTYRGALVVCQGGGQADVKLAVTEAVAVLTGLPADRITVAKWQ